MRTLQQWLAWQETLHPNAIDLGLSRVAEVYQRLGGIKPAPLVITVAGTNGKGSSVAYLESILRQAGYRTGAYTSPHLLHYNERIRINGAAATDDAICRAFTRIDRARDTISLTYFEFGTLAALELFREQALDVVILEVGLGGRLDATNIINPDVALITNISLDHTRWLGTDVESIAAEKAGIMRANHPVIFSDPQQPTAIGATARNLGAPLYSLGREFSVQIQGDTWSWRSQGRHFEKLALPILLGRHQLNNAAGVLMVLTLLADRLPVAEKEIREGLRSVELPGRFQQHGDSPAIFFDVSHNPGATGVLAETLCALPRQGPWHAVAGFMEDKDLAGILRPLRGHIGHWFFCELAGVRGAKQARLAAAAKQAMLESVDYYPSPKAAFSAARQLTPVTGQILVFG